MKRVSDKIMAKRLLVTRSHGFTILPFVRLNARRYILYSIPFVGLLILLAFNASWLAFGLVVSFLFGLLYLYLKWLLGMRKSWPFLSRVMNWDEVKKISEDEPSA
ncbi:MAG: hypothetical protein DME25_06105 [Verrucomicrobia bacterium]|nr:MAG: hypothetical protein DME25_06105 [Verrucomicrobiota bacterium]